MADVMKPAIGFLECDPVRGLGFQVFTPGLCGL